LCAGCCAPFGRCPERDQGLCFEPCKKIFMHMLKSSRDGNPIDPLGQHHQQMSGMMSIHGCTQGAMGSNCEEMIKCLRKAHKKGQL